MAKSKPEEEPEPTPEESTKTKRAAVAADFEAKKGKAVRFCYMTNGPVYRTAPAKIVKVHRGADARGCLDLRVDMSGHGGGMVEHELVPAGDPNAGTEQPNRWLPPVDNGDDDEGE